MATILIDTNVLVYLFDTHNLDKLARARAVLKGLESQGEGCLSVQCLAEFVNASTTRLRPRLTPAQALMEVELFQRTWPVFNLTPLIVIQAARAVRDYQLAYYDAQIWATARLNGVAIVLSEDFQSGRTVEGVQFINPFADDFRLAALF
ncbi:MAG TPA: PIN domain-containing protein [Promineifilum sp.]|nr:PIN domain-containing protein [Promineifilum sp.]